MLHARSRRRMPLVMPTTVHIRRSYAECRYGQLHMTTAYPSGGGFDERTPLVCLHPMGSSSHYFAPTLPELGRDRSVYAFDLPGYGGSDAPTGDYMVAELATVIGEFLDSLRLRQVDVIGMQLGALLGIELAVQKSQFVRRVVIGSVPHFTAQETRAPEWTTLSPLPLEDGSHLLKEWQRLQHSRGVQLTPEQLTEELADILRGRRCNAGMLRAMLDYPTAKQLAGLRQPGLVLRPRDEYYEQTLRARQSYPQALLEDMPEAGSNIFAYQSQRVVQRIRQFLDA